MQTNGKPIPLSTRVREILRERGIAQVNLAELTNISPSFLSRLLSQRRPWTLPHVEAVAKALDLGVKDLVASTDAAMMVTPMGALIPREEYEKLERGLASVMTEAQTLRVERDALKTTNADMEEAVRALTTERDDAHAARDTALTDREGAEAHARKFATANALNQKYASEHRAAATLATSEVRRLEAENVALRSTLEEANQLVQTNYDALQQIAAQNRQLRAELARRGNEGDKIFLAGLIGLGLGAASRR